MATLRETAQAYMPQQTRNIAELDHFSAFLQTTQETHIDKDGKEFTVNVVEVDGEKYRVPDSVLKGIKAILEKLPKTEFFTVLKSGSGLATSYQVLPYQKDEKVE